MGEWVDSPDKTGNWWMATKRIPAPELCFYITGVRGFALQDSLGINRGPSDTRSGRELLFHGRNYASKDPVSAVDQLKEMWPEVKFMWCPRPTNPYEDEADHTLRSTNLGMIGEIDEVDGERVKVRIDVRGVNLPVEFPKSALVRLDVRPGTLFIWRPRERNELHEEDFEPLSLYGDPLPEEKMRAMIDRFMERRKKDEDNDDR